jgi:hypothetical protein
MKLIHFAVGAAMLAGTTAATAQDVPRTYDLGPVWTWSLIEVKPGMGDAYMAYLTGGGKAQRLARQKAGYELGYKILSVDDARDGEANLVLMIQYKNHAAFDITPEQDDAVDKAVEASMGKTPPLADREKMRISRGNRTGQELVFKK